MLWCWYFAGTSLVMRWVLGEVTAKSCVVVRGVSHSVNAAQPPVGYLSTRRAPAGHSTRRVRARASRREDHARASGSLAHAPGSLAGAGLGSGWGWRWVSLRGRWGPLGGYPYGQPGGLAYCIPAHPYCIPWGIPSLPIPSLCALPVAPAALLSCLWPTPRSSLASRPVPAPAPRGFLHLVSQLKIFKKS